MNKRDQIQNQLSNRILILDGALGTQIQKYNLTESEFRGDRFTNHPHELYGNYDILSITQPEIISEIHETYLKAGADIIETNTFNASQLPQSDYQSEDLVYEMNKAAAELAKQAADKFTALTPEKPRFVAGSIGPSNRICTSAEPEKYQTSQYTTFKNMKESYADSIHGLLDGGVDILLVETIYNIDNAQACLHAIEDVLKMRNLESFPIWISGTVTETKSCKIAGLAVTEFWNSLAHFKPMICGVNCSFGLESVSEVVDDLSKVADCFLALYPNAGLPDSSGNYSLSSEYMANNLVKICKSGKVNIVGGCCGTTPEYTELLKEKLSDFAS